MPPTEKQRLIDENQQLVREVIEESATRPLDAIERDILYFWTGVRPERRDE